MSIIPPTQSDTRFSTYRRNRVKRPPYDPATAWKDHQVTEAERRTAKHFRGELIRHGWYITRLIDQDPDHQAYKQNMQVEMHAMIDTLPLEDLAALVKMVQLLALTTDQMPDMVEFCRERGEAWYEQFKQTPEYAELKRRDETPRRRCVAKKR